MTDYEKKIIEILRKHGPSEEEFLLQQLQKTSTIEIDIRKEYNNMISSLFKERVIRYSGKKIKLSVE